MAYFNEELVNHDEETERALFAVLRRSGWRSASELDIAAYQSTTIINEDETEQVRWIRSYVLDEGGGTVGTVAIYEATGPEAIRRHARRAGLPMGEIVRVSTTLMVRPDPAPAAA